LDHNHTQKHNQNLAKSLFDFVFNHGFMFEFFFWIVFDKEYMKEERGLAWKKKMSCVVIITSYALIYIRVLLLLFC
jgi:hypothetical protein